MHIDTQQSRRTFLRRAAQLGGVGAAGPLLSSLGLIGEAAAAVPGSDYRAMVCVFLYGGNDQANTLIPYDGANYGAYQAARPSLAVDRGKLGATVLSPANNLGGRQFALHPALRSLHPIFAEGKLAPVLNIGTLVEPTTKAEYKSESVRVPPKLFSHNDQQSYTQAFHPEGADAGWAGRIGDFIQAANGSAALTCISLSGRSLWLSGRHVTPYTAKPGGVTELLSGATRLYGSTPAFDTMRYLITLQQQNSWIAQEHAEVVNRSLQLSDSITSALAQAPASNFKTFTSSGNGLADQLKMVARLISVGPSLGLRRQVFYVSMGGFDTHSNLLQTHPRLLQLLGKALSEFYAATLKLGVADKVTTLTASDFGRTLAENGDGSDHGWGGTQFVLGGAVKGGRIYGTPPAIGLNTSDDLGSGRLIPTTSVEQMAATLALWFGVPPTSLPLLMPNLINFSPSSWDMDFL